MILIFSGILIRVLKWKWPIFVAVLFEFVLNLVHLFTRLIKFFEYLLVLEFGQSMQYMKIVFLENAFWKDHVFVFEARDEIHEILLPKLHSQHLAVDFKFILKNFHIKRVLVLLALTV